MISRFGSSFGGDWLRLIGTRSATWALIRVTFLALLSLGYAGVPSDEIPTGWFDAKEQPGARLVEVGLEDNETYDTDNMEDLSGWWSEDDPQGADYSQTLLSSHHCDTECHKLRGFGNRYTCSWSGPCSRVSLDNSAERRTSTYRCNHRCYRLRRRRVQTHCYWASTCSCTNGPSNSYYLTTGPDGSNACPWGCRAGYEKVSSWCLPIRRRRTTTTTTVTRTTTTHTSTTTATTLTSTTTSTSTVTVTFPTLCNEHEMQCPVPSNYRSQVYYTVGNWSDEVCHGGGEGAAPFVRFNMGTCNTSRTVDYARGLVVRTATLKPRIPRGAIRFETLPTVVCRCTYPLEGSVAGGLNYTERVIKEEFNGTFTPFMQVFGNDSFKHPVVPPDTFPNSSHIYFEVASKAADDIIEVTNCFCSPTKDYLHPFAVKVVDARCSTGEVPLTWISPPARNRVRISLKRFHFNDFPSLHIFCDVRRCSDSATCGVCESTGDHQRLLSEKRLLAAAASPRSKRASQSITVSPLGERFPHSMPLQHRAIREPRADGRVSAGDAGIYCNLYIPSANFNTLHIAALVTMLKRRLLLGLGQGSPSGVRAQSVDLLSGNSSEGGPALWTVLVVHLTLPGLSVPALGDVAERIMLQPRGLTEQMRTALAQIGMPTAVLTAKLASPPAAPSQHSAPSPEHQHSGKKEGKTESSSVAPWIIIMSIPCLCCAGCFFCSRRCGRKSNRVSSQPCAPKGWECEAAVHT